ncbi:MAG: DUF4252 domain-containing protein [Bacteroidetes bacterium]|nr:DUF4252 domain-containing protein [Bacteroidota bacterium]
MKLNVLKLTWIALLCMPLISSAQKSPMDALYEKYVGKEGFTSVLIPKDMFLMFQDIETSGQDKDFKDFQSVVGKLEGLKILTYEPQGKGDSFNFYDEIMKTFPMSLYTVLMEVNEGGESTKFYIKKDGPKITELLMIGREADETVVLSITGDIDMSSISKLSKSMKVEGMENLQKIEDDKK